MWYPSRLQWVVIWLTGVLALTLWVGGAPYGRGQDRAAAAVLILGALLVWQLAGGRSKVAAPASAAGTVERSRVGGRGADGFLFGALWVLTVARGLVLLYAGLAIVLTGDQVSQWFGGVRVEAWSPLVDAGLLLLLGFAVRSRRLWAAYGIALHTMFGVVGQVAGIITGPHQAIALSLGLVTLFLALGVIWRLFRVQARSEPFQLDLPFLAKWFLLTAAVGFVGGFAGSLFRARLGGDDSLGAQMPAMVAGYLQLALFTVAASRKRVWGLEHLLFIVALMMPLDALALKPERIAIAQWFGNYLAVVAKAFIAWGIAKLLPRPVPKVPRLALGTVAVVAVLAAWGLGVRFRDAGKAPAQVELEAQMQRALERLEKEGRLPRDADAARALGAMLVGEGLKRLSDEQLATVLRGQRAILDLTDQDSCAAMWERGLPADVAYALIRYLPEQQQREWLQLVGAAMEAETNGSPPKRDAPAESEVDAAFRTLYARMPAADATELQQAFASDNLPPEAACHATRILYGHLGQAPPGTAVLIVRATLYN